MSSKDLVPKTEAPLPALVDEDVFADAGIGFENVGKEDLAIPMLKPLQQLSPQLSPKKTEYIVGAKAGEIFNSLSQVRYDGERGITVIPVAFIKSYIEWIPRAQGGGIVHNYGSDASIMTEASRDEVTGKMVLKNGNELVESANYYVLVVDDEGNYTRAMMAFAGTQLKYSRRWITLAGEIKLPRPDGNGKFSPPIFYMSYQITLGMDSNKKGDWYTWRPAVKCPTMQLPGGKQLYAEAKAFANAIRDGRVKAPDPETVASTTAEGSDEDDIAY